MENTEQTQEQLSALLQVRRDKLTELQNDGRDPFKITKFERTHTSAQLKENYTEEERELKKRGSDEVQIIKAQVSQFDGQTVSIAGRIMSKRGMGKVGFVHVSDIDGQIQLFVKKDILGEDEYARFKKLDIGDIIGAEGEVFTTQTGEISVRAEKITLLSKSLLPLPEKFHGMTDTDLRYRQRYIDLIMNADVKKTFINRSKIIASIRSYLNGQNFLEVETPMLVANAGGAAARPFETHFNALDEDFKLRISLELYLKRLIVGGFDKVYEIGRVFRNEGLDTRHNPEFTLMELYQAYTDYHGMMDLTENLYRHVAKEVLGTTTIVYNGIEMDLGTQLKSTQALTLTKLIHLKRLVRLPMSTTLNMRTDIRRAIFLTCSLKNMQRNTLFNRLSLWIIRLKFHRLQRKSLKTLITLNVLSSL